MGQAGSVAALSAEEKRLLVDSWAPVRKEPKKNAIALVMAFFTKYPDQQKRFPAFADVPLDQLSTHPKFIAHALSVVFAFSSIISSIDDDDIVEAIITKQLSNHIPRGVTSQTYKDLQGVILGYLTPHTNADGAKAWVHAFEVFNAHAEEILK